MPSTLQLLKTEILKVRQAPTSPMSRKIATMNPRTSKLTKPDVMNILGDFLGYIPQESLHDGAERGIVRAYSQKWEADTLPIPVTEHNGSFAMNPPPQPLPDITYGYSADLFTESELRHGERLSPATRVSDEEPLWPFLVIEWNADSGKMNDSRLAAMRDGLAAVNTLGHLFNETGTTRLSAHETAVFCLIIGPEIIDINMIWRSDDSSDGISWEMDRIYGALLYQQDQVFHVRSILSNILNWARTTRLDRIKAALRPLKRRRDDDEDLEDSRRRRRAKRSRTNETNRTARDQQSETTEGRGLRYIRRGGR
ncbi:hypothetical protein MMC15_007396 [Xylographa vitiligo]|nr:hypothetical protein [Xylographa vitiligo]